MEQYFEMEIYANAINAKCNSTEITWTNTVLSKMLQRCAALKTLS